MKKESSFVSYSFEIPASAQLPGSPDEQRGSQGAAPRGDRARAPS